MPENWLINDSFCDEIRVAEASNTIDAYKKSILARVLEFSQTVRQ